MSKLKAPIRPRPDEIFRLEGMRGGQVKFWMSGVIFQLSDLSLFSVRNLRVPGFFKVIPLQSNNL
jgi:hypothetical protein